MQAAQQELRRIKEGDRVEATTASEVLFLPDPCFDVPHLAIVYSAELL